MTTNRDQRDLIVRLGLQELPDWTKQENFNNMPELSCRFVIPALHLEARFATPADVYQDHVRQWAQILWDGYAARRP